MLQRLKRTIESSCGKIYILYWKDCRFFYLLFPVVISFLNTRWVMERKCSLHWILQEFSVTITELLIYMPRSQWLFFPNPQFWAGLLCTWKAVLSITIAVSKNALRIYAKRWWCKFQDAFSPLTYALVVWSIAYGLFDWFLNAFREMRSFRGKDF